MSTTAILLVVCLTGLLLMYLIYQRNHYSKLTRTLMDILMATTLGSGMIVLLRLIFVD